jgi:hypothetical protein
MTSASRTRDDFENSAKGAWADFLTMFAGVLLIISAGFEVLQGAAAVSDPDFFASGSEYLYKLNVTAWGWIHIILGVLSAIVAIGIFMEKSWAWFCGVVIVGLTMLSNFAAIPHYPVWSLTIIAIDVAIIWALTMQLGRRQ